MCQLQKFLRQKRARCIQEDIALETLVFLLAVHHQQIPVIELDPPDCGVRHLCIEAFSDEDIPKGTTLLIYP